MKIRPLAIILIIITVFLTGCTLFKPVNPEKVLTNPIGTDSIKVGMTKDQVRSLLGDPDSIVSRGRTKDVLSSDLEEWTYRGRYTNMPVKADYFGKNLVLNFDGDNLTNFKSTQ